MICSRLYTFFIWDFALGYIGTFYIIFESKIVRLQKRSTNSTQKNNKLYIPPPMRKLFFMLVCPLWAYCQDYLPKSEGQLIQHSVLTLSYSEPHEQAEWVYYESSAALTEGAYARQNDFRADTQISTESASLSDYRASGYDRGHLAPAQDMKSSALTMSESFLLSNMSPQLPGFNRGVTWRALEDVVHNWGSDNIIVVTGPVFQDNLGTIGANQVTIPGYYYKVIYKPATQQMIAFLLPHRKEKSPLQNTTVTVDRLENMTGIDFFPQLEDDLEDRLEGTVQLSGWNFSRSAKNYSKKNTSKSSAATKSNTSSQNSSLSRCKGTAKSSGKQCKKTTKNPIGYCRYHVNQAG